VNPVLIVKCGDAVSEVRERRGDYHDWIIPALGVPTEVVSVHEDEPLPGVSGFSGVVVTGSPSMVSARAEWSERTARWLASVPEAQVPMLGICFGHQLVAHALGGRVGPNPHGREMGTFDVRFEQHTNDALLGAMPASAPFQVTHVESVLGLPDGARRLASSRLERNHAYIVGTRIWGVQFHPEFDDDVMRGYLEARSEVLRAEGHDPDAMRVATRPSPMGPRLLRRFGEIATAHANA
jgi:GMP synthase (glutamine-hydrolysing)